IPELGTIKANSVPYVFITSNKTRDLSDAIRRRCIYLNLSYPKEERELEIIKRKVPNVREDVVKSAIRIVNELRNDDEIIHKPGVSETIDFVNAILTLNVKNIDYDTIKQLITTLLKDEEDIRHFVSKNERGRIDSQDS
ncbi:ATPase, partial [Sulfolobus sp. F3]